MAFQSNGPVMLALPPFRGFTRRIILVAAGAWLAQLVLGIALGRHFETLLGYLVLQPRMLAHGMVWQTVTYPFLGMGLLTLLFALLTVWFFGAQLEDDRGSRWLAEFFFASAIGGALLATAICYAVGPWTAALDPGRGMLTAGLWPAVMAIMLAFAWFYPNEKIRLMMVFPVRAKIVAALYLGYYLLTVRWGEDKFGPLVVLANALCGWLFLRWVPRRGLAFAASEKWYALRNDFYRAKRRKAAKQFEVYMRKQGRDVRVEDAHVPDSKDNKWMN